jgi:hypothetical protein
LQSLHASIIALVAIIGAIASAFANSDQIMKAGTIAERAPGVWLGWLRRSLDWIALNTGVRFWEANIHLALLLPFIWLVALSAKLSGSVVTTTDERLKRIAWRKLLNHEGADQPDGWLDRISSYVPTHVFFGVIAFTALVFGASDEAIWTNMMLRLALMFAGMMLLISLPDKITGTRLQYDSDIMAKFYTWQRKNKIDAAGLTHIDHSPFDSLPTDLRGHYLQMAMPEYIHGVYIERMWLVTLGATAAVALGYASARGWLGVLFS